MKRKPILYIQHTRQLNGENAFMMADFLESVVQMLWREFGDDMADFKGRVFPDDHISIHEYTYSKKYRMADDDF